MCHTDYEIPDEIMETHMCTAWHDSAHSTCLQYDSILPNGCKVCWLVRSTASNNKHRKRVEFMKACEIFIAKHLFCMDLSRDSLNIVSRWVSVFV